MASPLQKFRIWYIDQHQDPDEPYYRFDVEAQAQAQQIAFVDDVIKRGVAAFAPTSAEQARLIDLVVSRFYDWCNYEEANLFKYAASEISVYKYQEIEARIQWYFGEKVCRLWRYILNGLAVERSETLYPYPTRRGVFSRIVLNRRRSCFTVSCIAPARARIYKHFAR